MAKRLLDAGSESVELISIVNDDPADVQKYDLVGFAAPTDFWGPPVAVEAFIDSLPAAAGKPAFVFNTYGFYSGRTLKTLSALAAARGFTVICGQSFNMPENYPPLVAWGLKTRRAPAPREMRKLDRFISYLASRITAGGIPKAAPIRIGPLNYLMPPGSRTISKNMMGPKRVDPDLCTQCGVCVKVCPYRAIELNPLPVFDEEKCFGCWSCFSNCPQRAIYTRKLRGRGHYTQPAALADKLK